MSVHRIRCPECKYELIYATFRSDGSYRTGSSFGQLCARRSEIQVDDAMTCPALRAAAEPVLGALFPGRDGSA